MTIKQQTPPQLPDTENHEYQPPQPVLRTNRARQVTTNPPPLSTPTEPPVTQPKPQRKGIHHLFFAGIGMLLFLGGYMLLTGWVIPFFVGIGTHWQYGEAQLSQYDFNVGHGGMSHFIAQDDKGTIVVIEIVEAGSYPSHVYVSHLFSSDTNSSRVVTLAVVDTHHNGKPDLEITVTGEVIPIVLYNNGATFQATPQGSN